MRGFAAILVLLPILFFTFLILLIVVKNRNIDSLNSITLQTVPRSPEQEEKEASLEAINQEALQPTLQSAPSPIIESTPDPTIESKISFLAAPSPSPAPAPRLNIAASNVLPTNGYSRQVVTTERGNFTVSVVAGDLNSTRVIVDTASGGTCTNECPVLSLGDYAARSGAYAGINGPYFCPATYDSCSGKKNAFDTLLMNKNKVYFNSDNNVYSTVPAAIFYGNTARFVGQSLEWGRDTGVDSVIANYPLLLRDGNINFTGSGDGKLSSIGNRSFIGIKDNYAYIGVVSSATVADVAVVLKAMGMKNALNLDSGGSTALWFDGYKFGPGRGLPFGVLFIRK